MSIAWSRDADGILGTHTFWSTMVMIASSGA